MQCSSSHSGGTVTRTGVWAAGTHGGLWLALFLKEAIWILISQFAS